MISYQQLKAVNLELSAIVDDGKKGFEKITMRLEYINILDEMYINEYIINDGFDGRQLLDYLLQNNVINDKTKEELFQMGPSGSIRVILEKYCLFPIV